MSGHPERKFMVVSAVQTSQGIPCKEVAYIPQLSNLSPLFERGDRENRVAVSNRNRRRARKTLRMREIYADAPVRL